MFWGTWPNRIYIPPKTVDRDMTVLRFWESDGYSDDGSWLGQRNDVLGMALVDRKSTERPDGLWVNLYKYTNDHPRRRTSQLAGTALLKTGGSCPNVVRCDLPPKDDPRKSESS